MRESLCPLPQLLKGEIKMIGFIKTTLLNTSLISIKHIQCIEHYDGCIHVSMNNGTDYTVFDANKDTDYTLNKDIAESKKFLDRMIDRIFYILSYSQHDNVCIDIEIVKRDVIEELLKEAILGGKLK